jgi:hypothetical protein
MKKMRIHIISAIFLGALIIAGCQKKKEYPELTLGNSTAPVATLSNVADSLSEYYTYIELSSSMDGDVYYVAVPQGSDAPTADEIVLGQASDIGSSVVVDANVSYMVKLKGLSSGASYDLYAVATNTEEGKPSVVVGPVSITCKDLTAPYVSSMDPNNGATWVPRNISAITLTMNEDVTLVSASKIHIVDAFDESDLGVKGDVAVDGPVVTIQVTGIIPYLTDVAVILDKGAFKDAVDSLSPEYYVDGGSYALMFSIEDFVNMDNFIGAYQCHEVYYGGTYDVLFLQSDVYAVDVINMIDYGVVATLVFEEDSCYFPDQPSGLSAGGIPLNFVTSLFYGYSVYEPGTYTADGMSIHVNVWLYDPSDPANGVYFYDDLEFTKYITAGEKAVPQGDPSKIAKGFKPIPNWRNR